MTMENKEAIQPIEEDELEGITGGLIILDGGCTSPARETENSDGLTQCPPCHPET